MAVEMAKLSLWLVTLSRERPFSFLDHALKSGDSLLGITKLDQLRHLHLDPAIGERRQLAIGEGPAVIDAAVQRAVNLRRQLEAIPVVTIQDSEGKARLEAEATHGLRALRTVADLVVGCSLRAELPGQPSAEDQLAAEGALVAAALDPHQPPEIRGLAFGQVEDRAGLALNAGRPDSAPQRNPLHWPLAFPEIFAGGGRTGFDAMVGNPPFLGGKRISGAAGSDFREFIVTWLANGTKGNADLVTYFFLRATHLSNGFGFLATNTISQGDTREVGLDRITADGWTIHRAVKSTPWPGQATLEIAKVWLTKREWKGERYIGPHAVSGITPSLDASTRVTGNPERLAGNAGRSFIGSALNTEKFLVPTEEAEGLLADSPRNREVLFSYVNGDDLSNSPTHTASRWVINFFAWPVERARTYPSCYERAETRVRPEVMAKGRSYAGWAERWWQFWRVREELYDAIRGFDHVLVITRVSKVVQPAFVRTQQVFSDATAVFAYEDDFHFGVLTSAFHWWWAVTHASTLETRIRYTPTDCFDTFPQPPYSADVDAAGGALDEHRAALMVRNDEGLTKTYNRVHNPDDSSPGIPELRYLHVALDVAVRDAYGWPDLDLQHGFRQTSQGRRFTFGPTVEIEVLDRLLELNHRRYAEEVAAGLHEKKKGRGRARRQAPLADAPRLL